MTQPLFSPRGIAQLDAMVRPGMLCAFDFDGTLAAITALPEAAATLSALLPGLRALCRVTPVAVITGRAVDDVRRRLGFAPAHVIGNHGAEGLPGSEGSALAQRVDVAAWLRIFARERGPWREPGIHIEDKGASLSLHYRHASDPGAAEQALGERLPLLSPPPRVVAGKRVFNLVPAQAPDKGAALLALMRQCGADTAFYAGDDVTDEDVFGLRDARIFGLRVGAAADSAARWHVAAPADMRDVIESLLARLPGPTGFPDAHQESVRFLFGGKVHQPSRSP
jgi:trehalose 6-phosphate phosphatase